MSLKLRTKLGVALLILATGSSQDVYACSKVPVNIQRWSKSTVLFMGIATEDTVKTGPGDVTYSIATGHFGPAGDRPIYGQVVSVEKLPTVDAKRLPKGVSKVILVPWDYGADCSSTPYTRSVRWIKPGTRGLYNAALRSESHWIKGVPTLDVYSPEFTPYTTGEFGTRPRPADSPAPLSADELFPLLDFLPDLETVGFAPDATVEPLMKWAGENPALASRTPLSDFIWSATYSLRTAKMSRIVPPVTGTYRFTLSMTGMPDREFFGRTEAGPTSDWDISRAPRDNGFMANSRPIEGYYLTVTMAQTVKALPVACKDRMMNSEGYVALAVAKTAAVPGTDQWNGMIEPNFFTSAFPGDSTLKDYMKVWADAYGVRFNKRLPEETPAQFTMRQGEPMRVLYHFTPDSTRSLTLRGERISMDVAGCRGPS